MKTLPAPADNLDDVPHKACGIPPSVKPSGSSKTYEQTDAVLR